MKEFNNILEQLTIKKVLIIMLLVTFIIVLICIFYKRIKKGIREVIGEIKEDRKIEKEIELIEEQTGEKATLTPHRYNEIADALENAMDGINLYNGNKVAALFSDIQNRVDVLNLVTAFGTRDGETLGEWLRDDNVEDNVNEVLKLKGINYQF